MIKKYKILILIVLAVILCGSFYTYRKQSTSHLDFRACDSGKMQSNAEMIGCLRDLKNDLLKERELVFNEYLGLESPRVDPNFSIPLADVREKTTTWYKSTDIYRKALCEARVANYADGSGYFEGIEMCEIGLIREDIVFIQERIRELKEYSRNFVQ